MQGYQLSMIFTLPYSWKCLREKTFVNWQKIWFSQIVRLCCQEGHVPPHQKKVFGVSTKNPQNSWKFSPLKVSHSTVSARYSSLLCDSFIVHSSGIAKVGNTRYVPLQTGAVPVNYCCQINHKLVTKNAQKPTNQTFYSVVTYTACTLTYQSHHSHV